jgi:hypothetical protein
MLKKMFLGGSRKIAFSHSLSPSHSAAIVRAAPTRIFIFCQPIRGTVAVRPDRMGPLLGLKCRLTVQFLNR